MIMISKDDDFGSKGFATQVFEAIKPSLIKRFGDGETVQDFANEVHFFGFLALQHLSKDDFNFVAREIMQANLDVKPKQGLIAKLKKDPRFEP